VLSRGMRELLVTVIWWMGSDSVVGGLRAGLNASFLPLCICHFALDDWVGMEWTKATLAYLSFCRADSYRERLPFSRLDEREPCSMIGWTLRLI
jgi:hypothetical protein